MVVVSLFLRESLWCWEAVVCGKDFAVVLQISQWRNERLVKFLGITACWVVTTSTTMIAQPPHHLQDSTAHPAISLPNSHTPPSFTPRMNHSDQNLNAHQWCFDTTPQPSIYSVPSHHDPKHYFVCPPSAFSTSSSSCILYPSYPRSISNSYLYLFLRCFVAPKNETQTKN